MLKQYEYYRTLVKRLRTQLKNAVSNEELKEANDRIAQLEGEILSLREENERVKAENEGLTKDKNELTELNSNLKVEVDTLNTAKKSLARKVEIANTLMVGNFSIYGVRIKKGQAQTVTKAKKASIIKVDFEILENRITDATEGVFFLSIFGPDGKLIKDPNQTGTTQLVEGSEIEYGHKKVVSYTQGERKRVQIDLPLTEKSFPSGIYNASIYNNGYKVGQASVELR